MSAYPRDCRLVVKLQSRQRGAQYQTNTRSSVHCDNAPNNDPVQKACECALQRRDELICAIRPFGVADAGQSWIMITRRTATSEFGGAR